MSKIIELVDSIADIFGYKETKEKAIKEGKRTIRLSTYDIEKALTDCYNFIAEGDKEHMCLIRLYDIKNDLIAHINTVDINDIENDNYEQQDKLRKLVREIVVSYNNWKKEEYLPRFEFYKKNNLFQEEEFTDDKISKMDPSIFLDIDKAVRDQLFKTYVFRAGSGMVKEHTKYHVYPTIGISHSLEEWFSFLEKQKDFKVSDHEAVVTLFYKLDYVSLHYNSFVITIHQKDSIWVSSDQIEFYNPRNKATRRNPARGREEYYKYIGLPYELDEELEEIRKNDKRIVSSKDFEHIHINRQIASEKFKEEIKDESYFDREMCAVLLEAREELKKRNIVYSSEIELENDGYSTFKRRKVIGFKHEGRLIATLVDKQETYLSINKSSEILFKDFKDIHVLSKMYFMGLVSRLFEQICFFPPQEHAMLAHTFVEQKMLAAATFTHNEDGFSGYQDTIQERVAEILESIDEKETALVLKKDFTSVVKSEHYERNWLATPNALNSLAKWTVLEGERDDLQKKINNALKHRGDEDRKVLENMLNKNKDKIFPILFASKEPYIVYSNYGTFSSKEGASYKHYFIADYKGDKRKKYEGWSNIKMLFDGDWKKPNCECCSDAPVASILKKINIRHYNQLLMIMDLKDRKDLPMYFRNYRAHDLIPYHGNSILDNTHPYALLKDPCSQENPNGIDIVVYMCKRCYNRLEKEYSIGKEEVIFDLERNIVDSDLKIVNTGIRI